MVAHLAPSNGRSPPFARLILPCAIATSAIASPQANRCSATSADNFKLCPHRHSNPRNAEICSQCGSRELSTPHPRIRMWLAPLVALLLARPGIALLGVTLLFLIGFINALVSSPQLLFQFTLVGLMLAFLWYLLVSLGISICAFRTSYSVSFPNYYGVPIVTIMIIKLPHSDSKKPACSPKARVDNPRNSVLLRPFSAVYPLQYYQGHCKGQFGANVGHPGPLPCPGFGPLHGKYTPSELGPPLGIHEVAVLIGCSPWTVRQTLIPRGIPHFRFKANSRLIFYQDQVIRWIQNQQQGGKR